ncbi:MAG TPA: RNA ligase partner protein [Patescibacteria group bacterium]|nr:RNA ligase partner protein [Patescibacteria group bacterium]
MEKFVIDTNFFINLEIKSGFGKNAKEVVCSFTAIAMSLKQDKKAEFFMPPRIVEEFLGFFDNEDFIKDFLKVITIKSPARLDLQFNADVFYTLVDEIRERSYRGLRIAEEAVNHAGRIMTGKINIDKMTFEKTIGESVKILREKYRQATRFNFLDSIADLDLIVLAKEQDGFLISSDEGVLRWGRKFGIKEVMPHLFKERLISLRGG